MDYSTPGLSVHHHATVFEITGEPRNHLPHVFQGTGFRRTVMISRKHNHSPSRKCCLQKKGGWSLKATPDPKAVRVIPEIKLFRHCWEGGCKPLNVQPWYIKSHLRWLTEGGVSHAPACAQSCLTLCNPRDCSPPGSFVHGALQARTLEWVAMPSSRGSSRPRMEPASLTLQAGSSPLCHLRILRVNRQPPGHLERSRGGCESPGHLWRGSGGPGDPGIRRNSLVCSFIWGHLFSFAQNHSWWEGVKAAGETPAVQWVSRSPQSRRPDSSKC